MKVIRKDSIYKKTFKELNVGDVFLDRDGNISIKTRKGYSIDNAIWLDEDYNIWNTYCHEENDKVKLLEAEMIIKEIKIEK